MMLDSRPIADPKIEVSVVVPVYKEERNIRPFLARLEPVLTALDLTYEVIFCLDPSPDRTEEIILEEINRNPRIRLVVFSRRFGQPAATMAGVLLCKGKTCVVIDVDLQDQPELIKPLYLKLREGYEVVYAKRRSRKGEPVLRKIMAYLWYKLMAAISDVPIPRNTGDYRIVTRRVIEELRRLHETHGFIRGLVAYVGFKQTYIEYDRDPRAGGKSNYSIWSSRIGLNGIFGFSSKPLQLMSIVGALFACLSFLVGIWYVVQKFIGIELTPGLPTTVLVVTFFSGVQLLSMGLIGEYVGRIYDEVKRRPMYIIDRTVNL